ncbi:hypothetical protein Fot_06179 [Forsythia ovata]|uniref:Uncharacterized protein n=1 Tax=Forsythia ovata TaxID=205694 RepID=A0ABD1WWC7_9LAMI
MSSGGIVVISKYCEGNNLTVEYPLGQKLCGLNSEDVSFDTNQMERHLEVISISYENYDSSTKRRLLVSLRLFLCSYYRGACLVSSQPTSPVLLSPTKGSLASYPYTQNVQS